MIDSKVIQASILSAIQSAPEPLKFSDLIDRLNFPAFDVRCDVLRLLTAGIIGWTIDGKVFNISS